LADNGRVPGQVPVDAGLRPGQRAAPVARQREDDVKAPRGLAQSRLARGTPVMGSLPEVIAGFLTRCDLAPATLDVVRGTPWGGSFFTSIKPATASTSADSPPNSAHNELTLPH